MPSKLLLAALALLLTACATSPALSLATSSPVPATLPPTPTATAAPRPSPTELPPSLTPAPSLTAVPSSPPPPSPSSSPSATPSAPPSATLTPPPGVTELAGDNVITFTSTVLGLTFSYRPSQMGANVRTFLSGDRVYVYYNDLAPTDGQYVQVFHKPPADSLAEAIHKQILAGYDPQACLVNSLSRPDDQYQPPPTFVFAWIRTPALPTASPSDDLVATQMAQVRKCPPVYTVAGGQVYFMEDTRYPDRFFFFKIGQYWIYSAGPDPYGYPWQDTLRVLAAPPLP